MLTFKMVSDNVLEVTEVIHGFTKSEYSYWYYDIVNWNNSSFGKLNDIPDREMNESDINWVKKYYIPKLKGN